MFAWWLSDCIKNKWNVLERLWGVIVMCSILNFLPHLFHQIMVKTLVQHKNWKTNSMKLQFPRLLVLHTTGSFKIRLRELLRTKMQIALNCGIFKKYELYLAGTIVSSLDDKLKAMYSALIHSTLLSRWLLSQVWNIKTHNLFIFSTEKIPRILNHKMVQGGDLIS